MIISSSATVKTEVSFPLETGGLKKWSEIKVNLRGKQMKWILPSQQPPLPPLSPSLTTMCLTEKSSNTICGAKKGLDQNSINPWTLFFSSCQFPLIFNSITGGARREKKGSWSSSFSYYSGDRIPLDLVYIRHFSSGPKKPRRKEGRKDN